MRAPIGHNAVGAVWRVAFPAITNDRMIRYADRRTVDNRQHWVRRFQACDAVWETFGTSGQLHEVSAGKRVLHLCGNVKWKTDQANAKSTQTAAGRPPRTADDLDKVYRPWPVLRAVEEPNRGWGCRSGRQTPRIDNVYGFQDRLEVH